MMDIAQSNKVFYFERNLKTFQKFKGTVRASGATMEKKKN